MAPHKERTMNHNTKIHPEFPLNAAELATLGEGQTVSYTHLTLPTTERV